MVIMADEELNSLRVQCPACNRPFCYHCSQVWHEGLSCLENQKSKEEEDPK